MEEKPWYVFQYENSEELHDKELKFLKYDDDDHDHCAVCWARFSQFDPDLHFGYYEKDSNNWICEECYNSFKDLFRWHLSDE